MRIRLTPVLVGVFAAVLASSAARAFTMENGDAAGPYDVPKFNLEEQAKHFRNGGTDTSSPGKLTTPLGNGTLEFGVRQGPVSNFNTGFGPGFGPGFGLGVGSRDSRQDFERMVAPPSLRDFYNDR